MPTFCRPVEKSQDEGDKCCMKRIKENNDPAAMCRRMGKSNDKGGTMILDYNI